MSATTRAAPPLGVAAAELQHGVRRRIPNNLHFKVAGGARACRMSKRPRRSALLREAAAQGSAEAYYEIYEHHRSWDRGDLDKVQLVTRAEADRGAAQGRRTRSSLCHADAGRTARRTATSSSAIPSPRDTGPERAVANPAKGTAAGDLLVTARTPAGDVRQAGRARPRSRHPRARSARARTCSAPSANWRSPSARTIRCARARCSRNPGVPTPAARSSPLARDADRGRRRPGRPQARGVAAERRLGQLRWRKGVLGQLYARRQTGAARRPGGGAPDRPASGYDFDARIQVLRLLAANTRRCGSIIPSTCSTTPPRPRNSTSPARCRP